jgi:methoxymalonate biosynthesis acyl carrier protein
MPDVAERLTEFLRDHVGPDVVLGPDDDLFGQGLVSSLVALQLVVFVEREFAFDVVDEDLSLDNFRSIAAITAFVGRRRGQ